MRTFANRTHAGKLLAKRLDHELAAWENPIVLALPRGGIPIAYEIHHALHLPWDLLLVKKIGAPGQAEFAIGAVVEGEEPIWNPSYSELESMPLALQAKLVQAAREKISLYANHWRPLRKAPLIARRSVILADDGIATGLTMEAAVLYAQKQSAKKVLVAAPVAARQAVDALESLGARVVTLLVPRVFFGVGQWYEDFAQVSFPCETDFRTV